MESENRYVPPVNEERPPVSRGPFWNRLTELCEPYRDQLELEELELEELEDEDELEELEDCP